MRALLVAEHLDGELLEAVEVDRRARRARRGRARCAYASSYARSTGTPAAMSARAIRPFEYGSPPRRRAAAARRSAARSCARPAGSQREQRLVEPVGDDVVRGEHDARGRARARARRRRRSRPPSARRGSVGVERASSPRSASRSARLRRDVDDVGLEVRDVGAGPAVNTATRARRAARAAAGAARARRAPGELAADRRRRGRRRAAGRC